MMCIDLGGLSIGGGSICNPVSQTSWASEHRELDFVQPEDLLKIYPLKSVTCRKESLYLSLIA